MNLQTRMGTGDHVHGNPLSYRPGRFCPGINRCSNGGDITTNQCRDEPATNSLPADDTYVRRFDH